jgi:DNA-binding NarL/FixJ family response regulator
MRKLRVLIADDHERILLAIVQLLSSDFKIVGVAGDGEQLVDSAISLNPDVIVTDVAMPLLSGPEAMKELNARGYDIPFVLVSVNPFCADELIRQGAFAFIDKCDIAHELVPAVHSAARGHIYVSRPACGKTANSVRSR